MHVAQYLWINGMKPTIVDEQCNIVGRSILTTNFLCLWHQLGICLYLKLTV